MTHLSEFYIDGRWHRPSSDAHIEVTNPATEERFSSVAEAQPADVDVAVGAARMAFDTGPWPRLSARERADYLSQIAAQIRTHAAQFARLWSSEVGAVHSLAQGMPIMVAGLFDQQAALAQTFAFEERFSPTETAARLLVREPLGVVAAIVPWNAPLMTIAFKLAPALLAGCTIVLKPSPIAPGAAYLFAEIVDSLGLPGGVVNVINADGAASEHLVRHPGIDKVSFTGSTTVGKRIAALCAERMVRTTLELGGKSPCLILDDYDLGKAAATLARSTRVMCGQVCASLTRVIVRQDRHDTFVEALRAALAAIKTGDPFDPSSEMGPLATREQRERVLRYIRIGQEEGAELVCGGQRPAGFARGFYVQPTLFAHARNGMRIAREEIFGPIVTVIPVADEEAAVAVANDSDYGLNASVFTNDTEHAYRIARRLRSGTVGHNAQRSDFTVAFGGFKQSGVGREGGVEGLLTFLETKTVLLEPTL